MSQIPPDLRRDIIDFLTRFMADQGQRQAVVNGALWGKSYLNKINWVGPPATFCSHLFDTLWNDGGVEAIIALLDEIYHTTGTGNQRTIDGFKTRLRALENGEGAGGGAAPVGGSQQSKPNQVFNIGSVTAEHLNMGGTETYYGDVTINHNDKPEDDDPNA